SLALAQRLLGPLAFSDVDVHHAPACDVCVGAAKRNGKYAKPLKDAIDAEVSLFVIKTIAGRDRMVKALQGARTILGMDRLAGHPVLEFFACSVHVLEH